MPVISVPTVIQAPIELVFDLARNVDVHCKTAAFTLERIVGGRTVGLLELGETVTFEGSHFLIRQRLTARIVEFEAPNRFVDEMVSGAFRSLRHVHEFVAIEGGTIMTDTIVWTSPLGLLGKLADLFVRPHLRRFLEKRNRELKGIAESFTPSSNPC